MSEMLEEIAEQPAALEKIFNTEKKRIPALPCPAPASLPAVAVA